jgi:hypothetical protein
MTGDLTLTRALSSRTAILRILSGVAILVLWRLVAKKFIFKVFGPVWTALGWPLFGLPVTVTGEPHASDSTSSVGPKPANFVLAKDKPIVDSEEGWEKAPVFPIPRNALDVVTKLIVYSGIAWWAVDGIPTVFHYLRI